MRTLLVMSLLAVICSCSARTPVEPRIDGSSKKAFYESVPIVAQSVEGTPREALFAKATQNALRRVFEAEGLKLDPTGENEAHEADERLRRKARESLDGLTADEAIERFVTPKTPTTTTAPK